MNRKELKTMKNLPQIWGETEDLAKVASVLGVRRSELQEELIRRDLVKGPRGSWKNPESSQRLLEMSESGLDIYDIADDLGNQWTAHALSTQLSRLRTLQKAKEETPPLLAPPTPDAKENGSPVGPEQEIEEAPSQEQEEAVPNCGGCGHSLADPKWHRTNGYPEDFPKVDLFMLVCRKCYFPLATLPTRKLAEKEEPIKAVASDLFEGIPAEHDIGG